MFEKRNVFWLIFRQSISSIEKKLSLLVFQQHLMFNCMLPRRVIVGFVSNEAFNGNNEMNPFHFWNARERPEQALNRKRKI